VNVYPVWRRAIDLDLTKLTGYRDYRVTFTPLPQKDYFEFPLNYDDFLTGVSDYDTNSDEIYCPCDTMLPWDGTAGDLLRRIAQHCGSSGHPMPRFER
jgi:hypothetical protein